MSLFVLFVGWVRCFVLNHAAKVLLFSHFGRLAKGQYQSCCPLWRKKVCFWGQTGWNLKKIFKKCSGFEKVATFLDYVPKKFGGI